MNILTNPGRDSLPHASLRSGAEPSHAQTRWELFKFAATLSLGIVTWLHGLNAAGLIDGAAWSGGLEHLLTALST
jgi:hypothetical protein